MAARRQPKTPPGRRNGAAQAQPEAAPRRPRHVRERVFVSADEWVKRLTQLERMAEKERKQFEEAKRLEISLTEDRMQALAMIRERFGPGEEGWKKAEEAFGCSAWTYKTWADAERNVQPRDQSFKRTAIALGIKYGFHD